MYGRTELIFIVLSGVPGSGKSTWCKSNIDRMAICTHFFGMMKPVRVISKDLLRPSSGKYDFNDTDEKEVTKRYWAIVSDSLHQHRDTIIILDNTHTDESELLAYLNLEAMSTRNKNIRVYYKFFNTPLWKILLRNIIRNFKERKTRRPIPFKYLINKHKNFKKINRQTFDSNLLDLSQ